MRLKKVIFFLLLAAVLYFAYKCFFGCEMGLREKFLHEERKKSWQELVQSINGEIAQFNGEPGIIVKDLETGWVFAYEKSKLFPSASLAKIPVMAACFTAAEQGHIKLDSEIALKRSDKLTGSGALKGMPVGTKFSVEKLIGLMIYDSDNTAANILTNLLGLDYLNSSFKSFGLKNTGLSRRIADYRSRDKGIENYTTAEDMASLLEKIYRRKLFNKRVSDECMRVLKLTRLNDRIPKYLPPEITVAHKTGLENGVCHDAGIVFTRSGDFIIVALMKHANPNSYKSKKFIARISFHAYKYFEQQYLTENQKTAGRCN